MTLFSINFSFNFAVSPESFFLATSKHQGFSECNKNVPKRKINRPLAAQRSIWDEKWQLWGFHFKWIFQLFPKRPKVWFWTTLWCFSLIFLFHREPFFDQFFIQFRGVSRTPLFSPFWATKVPVYPQKCGFGAIFDFPGIQKSADTGRCLGVVR